MNKKRMGGPLKIKVMHQIVKHSMISGSGLAGPSRTLREPLRVPGSVYVAYTIVPTMAL
jgi:hypothetical protein